MVAWSTSWLSLSRVKFCHNSTGFRNHFIHLDFLSQYPLDYYSHSGHLRGSSYDVKTSLPVCITSGQDLCPAYLCVVNRQTFSPVVLRHGFQLKALINHMFPNVCYHIHESKFII